MGYELPIIAGYTTFILVAFTAWLGGYLDPLQHKLQDVLLNKMGENRASYGVKTMMSTHVTDDKDVNAAQENLSKDVGGQVGKGGLGEGVGDSLSKAL